MTIFEEVYYELSNFPKFYRFEGTHTFRNYDFETQKPFLSNVDNYIYFSNSLTHHYYYIQKKLRQIIEKDILYEMKYTLQNKTVINNETFQFIVSQIESYFLEERQTSIEFITSPIIKKMFYKNYILNSKKESGIPYIERVDTTKQGGGYGLCQEWLEVFYLLTYIYRFQKLTKQDLFDYLYALRRNYCSPFKVNVVGFLQDKTRQTLKINETLFDDFKKYDLMNALESIVEKRLYFPDSFLAKNPSLFIKQSIQMYTLEREAILEMLDSSYQRKMSMKNV